MVKLFPIALIAALIIALYLLSYMFQIPHTNYAKIAEISKQDPRVQNYLKQHSNAKYKVIKAYLSSDGVVYMVDENWKPKGLGGSIAGKPIDGKDHYCWIVHWYDPSPGVPHIVDVFIDKETLKIVLVIEAV